MKTKDKFGISAGVSSILMVFVVLCLTTFGVLSLVTARADETMTDRTGQTVTNYYEADSKAQQKIAEIDSVLSTAAMGARSFILDGSYDETQIKNADRQVIDSIASGSSETEAKVQDCYLYFAELLISDIADVTVENVDFTDIVLGFSIPISDILELQTKLTLIDAFSGRYNISFYGVANIVDWSIDDDPVDFWDGT